MDYELREQQATANQFGILLWTVEVNYICWKKEIEWFILYEEETMDKLPRCKVPAKPCYALTPRGKCSKKGDCICKQKRVGDLLTHQEIGGDIE